MYCRKRLSSTSVPRKGRDSNFQHLHNLTGGGETIASLPSPKGSQHLKIIPGWEHPEKEHLPPFLLNRLLYLFLLFLPYPPIPTQKDCTGYSNEFLPFFMGIHFPPSPTRRASAPHIAPLPRPTSITRSFSFTSSIRRIKLGL